jgi:hypothetical protein
MSRRAFSTSTTASRIPAARLRSGDLIVELHGIGADGRESEEARYAVRVKIADRR